MKKLVTVIVSLSIFTGIYLFFWNLDVNTKKYIGLVNGLYFVAIFLLFHWYAQSLFSRFHALGNLLNPIIGSLTMFFSDVKRLEQKITDLDQSLRNYDKLEQRLHDLEIGKTKPVIEPNDKI